MDGVELKFDLNKDLGLSGFTTYSIANKIRGGRSSIPSPMKEKRVCQQGEYPMSKKLSVKPGEIT